MYDFFVFENYFYLFDCVVEEVVFEVGGFFCCVCEFVVGGDVWEFYYYWGD